MRLLILLLRAARFDIGRGSSVSHQGCTCRFTQPPATLHLPRLASL